MMIPMMIGMMTMNKFTARYNNAKRIMNKINDLLQKGYKVIDENGYNVESIIEADNTIYYTLKGSLIRCSLFMNDIDFDDGIHTPIKEFNKSFESWVYINPNHIKQLKV